MVLRVPASSTAADSSAKARALVAIVEQRASKLRASRSDLSKFEAGPVTMAMACGQLIHSPSSHDQFTLQNKELWDKKRYRDRDNDYFNTIIFNLLAIHKIKDAVNKWPPRQNAFVRFEKDLPASLRVSQNCTGNIQANKIFLKPERQVKFFPSWRQQCRVIDHD